MAPGSPTGSVASCHACPTRSRAPPCGSSSARPPRGGEWSSTRSSVCERCHHESPLETVRRAIHRASLRCLERVLRVVPRPLDGGHVRLLSRSRGQAGAGAGGQARPGLPQAAAAAGRDDARRRLRLGQPVDVGGAALRGAGPWRDALAPAGRVGRRADRAARDRRSLPGGIPGLARHPGRAMLRQDRGRRRDRARRHPQLPGVLRRPARASERRRAVPESRYPPRVPLEAHEPDRFPAALRVPQRRPVRLHRDRDRDGARALGDRGRGESASALRAHLPAVGRPPAGARRRGAGDRRRADLPHVAPVPHVLVGGVRSRIHRSLPDPHAQVRGSRPRPGAHHPRGPVRLMRDRTRIVAGLLAGLLLAADVPLAAAVEYRLLLTNLWEGGFVSLLKPGELDDGASGAGLNALEAALDRGEVPSGASLPDRHVQPVRESTSRGYGAARVIPQQVTVGGETRVLWDEIRWEGTPGEHSVWLVKASSLRPQQVDRVALKGSGPLRQFVPYTVPLGVFRFPALQYQLDFLWFYEERGTLWERYIARSLDLSNDIGVVVGTNFNPSFPDYV